MRRRDLQRMAAIFTHWILPLPLWMLLGVVILSEWIGKGCDAAGRGILWALRILP